MEGLISVVLRRVFVVGVTAVRVLLAGPELRLAPVGFSGLQGKVTGGRGQPRLLHWLQSCVSAGM